MGLSIGTTNMVAARVGNPPVIRRSVLTTSDQVVAGFVERVGDPVPLVTADGAAHQADQLVVEALAALVGDEPSDQLAVAVPAHWTGATLRALRAAMRDKPNLAPNGVAPRLVSDAVAALTALQANPGLPAGGVVVLLDFGGGGTGITLADAAASFEPIETVRHEDFSGDQLDRALLTHVLDASSDADALDTSRTAAVGSLSSLREDCTRAKEALSDDTEVELSVEVPGHSGSVRVTREQFEALAEPGLDTVCALIDEALQRNRIELADVTTVALVGGGARIPLLARRVSEHTGLPVVTSSQPALDAAVGAAVFAAYAADSEAATGVAPAPLIPPDLTDAATFTASGSATFRALAWSQADDTPDVDPLLFAEETGPTRAVAQYVPPTGPIAAAEPRTWHRLPQLVFGLAAVAALLAVGGAAIALTTATEDARPTPSTAPAPAISAPPARVLPPSSAPVEQVPTVAPVTEEPPPPPPPTQEQVVAPPVTVTETTMVPVTTTTTTTSPTTTTPTTTTTTSTTTTTTTTTTTSTTPAMTTSYITVPFVPVPIPIQVPNQGPPQPVYPQAPQYPQQPQYPY